jgi:hypothetical protein
MRPPPASLAFVVAAACGPAPAPAAPVSPEELCATPHLTHQEAVAAIASCTSVGTLTIRTANDLDFAPLAGLVEVRNTLQIGPSVGLDEIALPKLASVGVDILVFSNHDLRGVYLPALERTDQLVVDANVSLQTVSVPRLRQARRIAFLEAASLEMIDLSGLSVAAELEIAEAPDLALVEIGAQIAPRVEKVTIGKVPKLPADVADRLRGYAVQEAANPGPPPPHLGDP